MWIKLDDGTLVNPAFVEAIEPIKRPGSPPAIRFRTPSIIRTLEKADQIDAFLSLVNVDRVEVLGDS